MSNRAPIFDESNYQQLVDQAATWYPGGPGAFPRESTPGEVEGVPVFESRMQLIPRSDWDAHIAENDRTRAWLYDLMEHRKIPCTDQDGLGYCHSYAARSVVEIARLKAGHLYVALSAESIGGPITGWRNQGAAIDHALAQVSKYGACPASMMDRPHSLSPSRWQDGWQAKALDYRLVEWYDLDATDQGGNSRMFDKLATCALLAMPAEVAYSWWSHAIVAALRLKKTSNGYAILLRNSWGSS